ncbi:MAG: UbiA family prenyltransferase [Planctomycetes bacterium]|nr:UbiA family prenyltransferase [Planctomycetota bacterium]
MKAKLTAYLRLLRLPAVFTAMADVFLGFVCQRGDWQPLSMLISLLIGSSGLYLAGMVLNDVFDRHRDARQRPDRPIPSGVVTVREAVGLASLLIVVALLAAASVGRTAFATALMLTLAALAYDGWLKQTLAGPMTMGLCRLLNVLLGASAVHSLSAVWRLPQLHLAISLAVYVTGVTWLARSEIRAEARRSLLGAIGVVNLGVAGFATFVLNWPGTQPGSALLILLVVALTINRRLVIILAQPDPMRVRQAVGVLLGSIIILDATAVLFVSARVDLALGVAGLVVPYLFLRRRLAVT